MMNNYKKNVKEMYWKARSEYNSPYNDGWTQEYYKKVMDDLELKYGEIDFNNFGDIDDSEYTITLPDNVIKALKILPGDKLIWSVMSDGSCVLKKFDPQEVTEVYFG